MTSQFDGGCHCGVITYIYQTAVPPADWSIRACQCTFCLAHAALSTSDPQGSILFEVADAGCLQKYRFGLKTTDFLVCRNCGVYIGACIDTDRGSYGIVNVRALHEQPASMAAVLPISYDSENTAARVSRRQDRWTPVNRLP